MIQNIRIHTKAKHRLLQQVASQRREVVATAVNQILRVQTSMPGPVEAPHERG